MVALCAVAVGGTWGAGRIAQIPRYPTGACSVAAVPICRPLRPPSSSNRTTAVHSEPSLTVGFCSSERFGLTSSVMSSCATSLISYGSSAFWLSSSLPPSAVHDQRGHQLVALLPLPLDVLGLPRLELDTDDLPHIAQAFVIGVEQRTRTGLATGSSGF